MSVQFDELLNLSSLKDAKVVAGVNGLDRYVRWIHMAEMLDDIRQIIEWTEGEELLFVTGVGIKNEPMFLDFVRLSNENRISGILVYIGKYIHEIPESVVSLANELNFPIITLPWEVHAVRVTNDICEYIVRKRQAKVTVKSLLENILFFETKEIDLLVNQATLYGYDLKKSHQIMIIDVNRFSQYIKAQKLYKEVEIQGVKEQLLKVIEDVIKRSFRQFLSTTVSDSVICLLPLKKNNNKETMQLIADEIREQVKVHLHGLTVNVGIGNTYTYVDQFKKSLVEAQKTLEVLKSLKKIDKTEFYADLGANMLLIELKENKVLLYYKKSYLGDIETYDKTNHFNLKESLKIYLEENGNANKSAERLFIHRNTMKYRLDKIQDLTDYDLQDAKLVFNLQLAFEIDAILEGF